jgi:phosphate transport system substrate-binding protein
MKKYHWLIVTVLGVLLGVEVFQLTRTRPISPARPGQLGSGTTMLRLQGSNTIGSGLAPELAEAFLKNLGAQDVHRVPGAANEVSISGRLPNDELQTIDIAAHGTATAFEALATGKADIGMASRRINKEEQVRLAALGDFTSRASENVLALDGIAVIVHPSNPIEALTVEQVAALFTGKFQDWSQLGGSAGPVHLYAHDAKSGTFDTFRELVLHGEKIAQGAERLEGSEELSRRVARDPAGIGFTSMAFIGTTKALKISLGGSVPLRPMALTVRTEDYILSRRLYLYTPATSANPWARKFIEFSLSDAGQRIVDQMGFVGSPLSTSSIPTEVVTTNLPSAYAKLVRNAERLPFNFRFRSGTSELDTKAFHDLGRLVQFLADRDYRERQILLFGFSDRSGRQENDLTRARAEQVRRELIIAGISPAMIEVHTFGSELPVASNETEEGREKNRRVEIWLRR